MSEIFLKKINQEDIDIDEYDKKFFSNENDQQIEAIKHQSGEKNLIIIAGPGTGKTRVIIKRLHYLVEHPYKGKKINAEGIMVVTLTVRAIDEIIEKIENDIKTKNALNKLKYAGTLHSIASSCIKKNLQDLNNILKSDYEWVHILGEADQFKSLLKKIYSFEKNACYFKLHKRKDIKNDFVKQAQLFIYQVKLKAYMHKDNKFKYIKWENYDLNTSDYCHSIQESSFYGIEDLHQAFINHHENINKRMDFLDLLIFFHQLLINKKYTKTKEWMQENISHILVDEFQDINQLQLEILQEISGTKDGGKYPYNMFCVGDPNQSIFGFQGDLTKIFSSFESWCGKEYICTKILGCNYRSTKNIVEIANSSINNNLQKNPVTIECHEKAPQGKPIMILITKISAMQSLTAKPNINFAQTVKIAKSIKTREEKLFISKIKNLIDKQIKLSSVALMTRNHGGLFRFKALLMREKIKFINYQCLGAMEDLCAKIIICFACLCFPSNSDSFCVEFLISFFYKVDRIDKMTFKNFSESVGRKYSTLSEEEQRHGGWHACLKESEIVTENHASNTKPIIRVAKKDKDFMENLQKFIIELPQKDDIDVEYKIKDSFDAEYKIALFTDKLINQIPKILNFFDNLQTGFAYIQKFFKDVFELSVTAKYKSSKKITFDIKNFWFYALAYVRFLDNRPMDDYINLSTIHGAKGSEFKHVFLFDISENFLPTKFAVSEDAIAKEQKPQSPFTEIMEEERRVFYVGLTRAKENIYLFHNYSDDENPISRFINDLLEDPKNNCLIKKIEIDNDDFDKFWQDIDEQNMCEDKPAIAQEQTT